MFKGIANLSSLLKQAQQIGGRMHSLGEELKGRRVTGAAGGGLVEVEANGLAEVIRCRIDPSLIRQEDRELLEDLVTAAVNQALSKAKQLHTESLKSLTGGMEMPGLDEALSKLTSPGEADSGEDDSGEDDADDDDTGEDDSGEDDPDRARD